MGKLTEKHAMNIVDELAGSDAWNNWTNDDNIFIKDFFSWLWDGVVLNRVFKAGIEDLMIQEFNIYL